jgi:hypothetical protein
MGIIYLFYILQKRSNDRLLKKLRVEVEQLEDLVAAIIEEFEETVGAENILNQTHDSLPIIGASDMVANIPENTVMKPVDSNVLFSESHVSKQQQILNLWDQGTPVPEIARKLGTGRGEVQLILGIHRKS